MQKDSKNQKMASLEGVGVVSGQKSPFGLAKKSKYKQNFRKST